MLVCPGVLCVGVLRVGVLRVGVLRVGVLRVGVLWVCCCVCVACDTSSGGVYVPCIYTQAS